MVTYLLSTLDYQVKSQNKHMTWTTQITGLLHIDPDLLREGESWLGVNEFGAETTGNSKKKKKTLSTEKKWDTRE